MNDILPIHGFAQDGFAVRPLFAPAEIALLQQEVAAYMDRIARALCTPYDKTEPAAPFDERIETIAAHDPSYAHLLGAAVCTDAHLMPAFQAIANDPRLKDAAETLLGGPLGAMTVRLRGNSSAMGEHRHDWHSDVAKADGGPCSTIKLTAWLPLTAAGPTTGGMEVAAGRRAEPLEHLQGANRFAIPEESLGDGPRTAIDCPQGSCLFLDRYTPHRALPNTTGKTRWALVMWMKSAAAH